MSNWTHVAGIVRIDSLRILDDESFDFERVFGKELRFDDGYEAFDDAQANPEKYLPLGSEGSLTMSVWSNPDIHDVTAYTVSIFGDLRDHDSPKEIIRWFKGKCNLFGGRIRNACIVANNEWNGTESWHYDERYKR